MTPLIRAFFDPPTGTLSYIVWERESRDAVIIDPVLNYDPVTSRISDEGITDLIAFLRKNQLQPHFVLETHVHADHLTGCRELQRQMPNIKVAIGARIVEVQHALKKLFNLGEDFATDGQQFDLLLEHGQSLEAGQLVIKALGVPGHTPACIAYLIEDALFTGDSLFMPDFGVGRCDFPGGSAEVLFDSVTSRLYVLADSTRVFVGHDYLPHGRQLLYESTIGDEKANNIHLSRDTGKRDFITFRVARDQSLPLPRLMFQSLQINMNGGSLPQPESNGVSYIKIPLRRSSD